MRRVLPFCLLLLAGTAYAQTFPKAPTDTFVYDGADLLSAKEEKEITELSQNFLKNTGAPLMVATFPTIEGQGISDYGAALFKAWRVGRGNEKGGLLLIVAKRERNAHVEVGEDWLHDFAGPVKGMMDAEILPAMSRRDYRTALLDGTADLASLGDRHSSQKGAPGGPPLVEQTGLRPPKEAEARPLDMGGLLRIVALCLSVLAIGALAWGRRKKTT